CARTASMSSSATRIFRPFPSPLNGIEVRPGQPITIRSPSPFTRRICWCLSPTPNARRSETAVVPQMMPKIVRNVRSFWERRSRQSWRKASVMARLALRRRDFLRRLLDELLARREPGNDLDVQSVRDPELDFRFDGLSLGVRRGDLDDGLVAPFL